MVFYRRVLGPEPNSLIEYKLRKIILSYFTEKLKMITPRKADDKRVNIPL